MEEVTTSCRTDVRVEIELSDPLFCALPKGRLYGRTRHYDPEERILTLGFSFDNQDLVRALKCLRSDPAYTHSVDTSLFATQAEVVCVALNARLMPDWHPEVHTGDFFAAYN